MRTKLRIAGLLTLGILIIAVVLLLLAQPAVQDEAPVETARYSVTDFSAENAAAIEVKNTAGEVYIIRLGAEGVSIDGIDPGVPLRRTLLLPVVSMLLQSVSYSEPLPAERAEEYGLDRPRAVFTIHLKDGTVAVLRLGNETVKKNGLYLWREDSDLVYVVEYAYAALAGYGAWDYVEPVLAEIDQSSGFTVSHLILINREAGTELEITRKAAGSAGPSIYSYQVQGLDIYDAADEKLNAYLFEQINPLRAVGVHSLDVSEDHLEKLGLLAPAYTLSFTDDRKGESSFRFSRLEDGRVLAVAEGTPVIYELEKADASFLDLTLDQIVSPFLTLQSITEVEQLIVWDGEREYVFDLQNGSESGELQVSYEGSSLDTASFRRLYSRAAAIYIQGMAEPPETEEPVLRLTYSRRDGAVCVIEFFDLDGRRCFAAVNGRGEFYVRLTDMEYFLDGLYACVRGEMLTE